MGWWAVMEDGKGLVTKYRPLLKILVSPGSKSKKGSHA
jgi:hypothetical protein